MHPILFLDLATRHKLKLKLVRTNSSNLSLQSLFSFCTLTACSLVFNDMPSL